MSKRYSARITFQDEISGDCKVPRFSAEEQRKLDEISEKYGRKRKGKETAPRYVRAEVTASFTVFARMDEGETVEDVAERAISDRSGSEHVEYGGLEVHGRDIAKRKACPTCLRAMHVDLDGLDRIVQTCLPCQRRRGKTTR